MAKLNGSADAMYLLGRLCEGFEAIKLDVSDLRTDMSAVKADVATVKANQRPRRHLHIPSWRTTRFILAGAFTLTAALMRIDPKWVAEVVSGLTR